MIAFEEPLKVRKARELVNTLENSLSWCPPDYPEKSQAWAAIYSDAMVLLARMEAQLKIENLREPKE